MNCSLLFIFLISIPAQYVMAQTSIVAVRTPSEIVIGADSKISTGWDLAVHGSKCKINQFGSVIFAGAGFLAHPPTGYNADDLVIAAGQRTAPLGDQVGSFERSLVGPLKRALEWVKRHNPEFFAHQLEGREVVQIVFATVERGAPVLLARCFTARSSAEDGAVTITTSYRRDCPGDCPTGSFFVLLGQSDAARELLAKYPRLWRLGLTDAVRFLVTLEAIDKPEEVGLPIDIVQIRGSEVRWAHRKNECREEKKPK